MSTLIILGIFLGLGVMTLGLTEVRERRKKKEEAAKPAEENPQGKKMVRVPVDDQCCGTHLICEREMLLQRSTKEIEYYDDEELDALAGRKPEDYTDEEVKELDEVFQTLQEKDVAGWLRSLQARGIELPEGVKEEALFIVGERRRKL